MSHGDTPRRGHNLDRVIGIFIGLILGIGIVTAFVFLGSEDTIDAPRINTTTRESSMTGPNGSPVPDNEASGAGQK